MIKFKAWDKRENRYRDDVVIGSNGHPHIVRSSPEFSKMVNRWYKKRGDILGGDYAEIDYTDWYAIEYIEIQFEKQ